MLGIKETQEIIPYRHPSLLVGRIEELEPGVGAVDYKCMTFNESFFTGRLPGEPVIPGVLTIEALVQAGSVAMLSVETYKGRTGYFGTINNAKFKQMVRPGDRLHLECEVIKQKGLVGIGKATATVDGKLAASAEPTLTVG